jgi:hypothetical protein
MKPGEPIRFRCGECHIVFDLCLADPTERAEQDPDDQAEDLEVACCFVRVFIDRPPPS